ncbi:PKD domain-containing protein, partial [Candidatus Bipolaricaulota bacterium]|nr:PKD domain-containing protein [Candidatus Bipolaricaulota bacterium]
VELPANIPPTAIIRPPTTDIAEQENVAWFGNTSLDPDGRIVLYQWAFDGETQRVTTNFAQWFTFRSSGTHTIGLTVTDSRGAQASTSLTLYVMTAEEAEADCGCGG